MNIHESGEDYLETILVLEQRNGTVRSIDIANEMNYSKPSVSRAMSILRRAGMLEMDEHGHLLLTEQGRARAESVYDRHRTISRVLQEVLGVSPETADHDACRIEHIISTETFTSLKRLLREHRRTQPQESAELADGI